MTTFIRTTIAGVACCSALWAPLVSHREAWFTKAYRLDSDEVVFAYARVSPDGRAVAYASEPRSGSTDTTTRQTLKVVELATRRVLFQEPGVDAYWSTDGTRIVYLSFGRGVSIHRFSDGRTARNIAPQSLGDYFSWGTRNGHDVISTVKGNYFELEADRGIMPAKAIAPCDGMGTGERPLMSHDGRRVSVFVDGAIAVRDIDGCSGIVRTGLQGAKADFSFDGRYIAFHGPKHPSSKQSDVFVVDLRDRTVRNITELLSGSSLFPSWTQDGRLLFRYDAGDYRGFVMADDVLNTRQKPLSGREPVRRPLSWKDITAAALPSTSRVVLLTVWGTWSAHAPDTLRELQRAEELLSSAGNRIQVRIGLEPGSLQIDADAILHEENITLRQTIIDPLGFNRTVGRNQIPSTLLFDNGNLVANKLGPFTSSEIVSWVRSVQVGVHPPQ